MNSLRMARKALGLILALFLVTSTIIVVLGIWGAIDGEIVGKALASTFFLMFASIGILLSIKIFGAK
jgi:hypothetical protein